MNIFELYYTYLEQCKKDNWENMRDPNHDFMDWNHTLPQCIFGDQPLGQWLTKEQHSNVSGLQTLMFKRQCHGGFHEPLMYPLLWETTRPYIQGLFSSLGKIHGQLNVDLGRGIWSQTPEQWEETRRKGGESAGRKSVTEKTGIHTEDESLRFEWASMGGRTNKGKLYWNNGKINQRSKNCPGEGWVPGILTDRWKNKTSEEKNRLKSFLSNKFKCLVTGRVSHSTGLTKIQKRLGIDTSLRIRIQPQNLHHVFKSE